MKKQLTIFCLLAFCALLTFSIPSNKGTPKVKYTHELIAKAQIQSQPVIAEVNSFSVEKPSLASEAVTSRFIEIDRPRTPSKAIYAKPQNERRCINPELEVFHSPPLCKVNENTI